LFGMEVGVELGRVCPSTVTNRKIRARWHRRERHCQK
jgi:hypothetical protein